MNGVARAFQFARALNWYRHAARGTLGPHVVRRFLIARVLRHFGL